MIKYGFILMAGCLLSLCAFSPAGITKYKVKAIVIDAGHGGKDPGCIGKISRESNIALKVALELGKIIKEQLPDVKVIYTRKDDTFIPLDERSAIANRNNADLFLSIHCNANEKKTVFGTETYVMGLHTSEENLQVAMRENSVILQEEDYLKKYDGFDPQSPLAYIIMANMQSAYIDNSLRIASKIEDQFATRVKRHSRGVKQAGFVVLRKSAMPSALIEIGYLSNVQEEKYLNTTLAQVYIASAIYRAVRDYKKEIEE